MGFSLCFGLRNAFQSVAWPQSCEFAACCYGSPCLYVGLTAYVGCLSHFEPFRPAASEVPIRDLGETEGQNEFHLLTGPPEALAEGSYFGGRAAAVEPSAGCSVLSLLMPRAKYLVR